MATIASRLLRAARDASAASRAAAAAASRARRLVEMHRRRDSFSKADSFPSFGEPLPDNGLDDLRGNNYKYVTDDLRGNNYKYVTDKDLESDEALWSLYERWCKAFNKERDHADMTRRFSIFRFSAEAVHGWNTYLPPDPKEAAIFRQKQREAELLLSKDKFVDSWYLPMELGQFADGGDPFNSDHLLTKNEEMDASPVSPASKEKI